LLFLLLLLWSLLLLVLVVVVMVLPVPLLLLRFFQQLCVPVLASPSRRFGAWRRVSNMKLDLTPRVLLLARQAPLMAIFCFIFCFLSCFLFCFFLCFPSRQMAHRIHHRHICYRQVILPSLHVYSLPLPSAQCFLHWQGWEPQLLIFPANLS
jgi:hypothetical protein